MHFIYLKFKKYNYSLKIIKNIFYTIKYYYQKCGCTFSDIWNENMRFYSYTDAED